MGTALNNVLGIDLAATVSNGNTSEQDANAALLDLDKTLRSTKVGDQCEGIVRYARYGDMEDNVEMDTFVNSGIKVRPKMVSIDL